LRVALKFARQNSEHKVKKKREICVSFLYPQQVFLLKGWSMKTKKFCNPKKNGNTVDENYSAGAFPRLA
jgi:hypothetical protein